MVIIQIFFYPLCNKEFELSVHDSVFEKDVSDLNMT